MNFLPNFPSGQNEDSLEEMRLQMKAEVDRADRNLQSIEKLMQTTFALRRQEIVQGDPLVKDFLERWPSLRVQSQVKKNRLKSVYEVFLFGVLLSLSHTVCHCYFVGLC